MPTSKTKVRKTPRCNKVKIHSWRCSEGLLGWSRLRSFFFSGPWEFWGGFFGGTGAVAYVCDEPPCHSRGQWDIQVLRVCRGFNVDYLGNRLNATGLTPVFVLGCVVRLHAWHTTIGIYIYSAVYTLSTKSKGNVPPK